MVDVRRKTDESNGIEKIVNNDGILWLNEKHIEEGLDHKNLREITTKYSPNHRKQRYELVEERIEFLYRKICNQSDYGL